MRRYLQSLLLMLCMFAMPTTAFAQADVETISTAGADCSTATNCAVFGLRGYTSIGIYLNVAASGTFVFEATTDADPDAGTWFAIVDDVNAAANATADGAFFFTNPGYSYVRLRASAISGAATATAFRGFASLRSTATLSGEAQGDGAILDGVTPAIKATVADLTSSNPLASMIVDANGDQITSFGGGVQYNTADADATPTGTVALGWDGTNVRAFATNASGHLNVIFPSAQAVSQSGTWNINNVSGTISLPTGASTAAKQPALGTAGSPSADVITVQGHASGTPLPNTDAGVGATTDAAATAGSTGSLNAKMRLLTEQTDDIRTAVEGTLLVDIASINGQTPLDAASSATLQSAAGANGNGSALSVNGYGFVVFTVNCSVSCSGGTTITLEATEDGTNFATLRRAQRLDNGEFGGVILNQTNTAATIWGAAIGGLQSVRARISAYSAGTITVTARAVSGAPGWYVTGDPCATETKSTTAISQTTIANLITADSTKKNYVCSLVLNVHAAEIISLVEDDTTACASPTAALLGSTTAASGLSMAANGGLTYGNGESTIFVGSATNRYLCVLQDGSDRVSGSITWVQR